MEKYKVIEHTADSGIKVFGESIEGLFENAAYGMFDIITDIEDVDSGEVKQDVNLSSEDLNELMVEWLSELLFKFDADKILFSEFNVINIDTYSLNAKIKGETYKENKHDLKREIKAVTYHTMSIKRENNKWAVQVIFDT